MMIYSKSKHVNVFIYGSTSEAPVFTTGRQTTRPAAGILEYNITSTRALPITRT